MADEIDLGVIWETTSLNVPLRLINHSGSETFRIGSFRGGCSCVSFSQKTLQVPPSAEATVVAEFVFERATDPDSAPWQFSTTVYALAQDDQGAPRALSTHIRATVRPWCAMEPALLSFGTTVRDRPSQKMVNIRLGPHAEVDRLGIASLSGPFAASVEGVPDAKDTLRLKTRVLPNAPYGLVEGTLILQAYSRDKPLATRSLLLRAFVVDDLQVQPSPLVIGAVPVGEKRTAWVNVFSAKREAFSIQSIAGLTDVLTVDADMPTPKAASHAITLTFAPTAHDRLNATVGLVLQAEGGRRYVLELPVIAYAPDTLRPSKDFPPRREPKSPIRRTSTAIPSSEVSAGVRR